MSHSVAKQAIPTEFLEEIRSDRKLQKLIVGIWSYGSRGMFEWFNQPPTVSFKYCPRTVADEFKKDYREDYKEFGSSVNKEQFPFDPKEELDAYCTLLNQKIKQMQTRDSQLEKCKVYLGTRIDEQIHFCLLKELEAGAINISESLVSDAIWGGTQFENVWELRYLEPEQVKEVAHILRGVTVDRLINHFDALPYNLNDWIENFRKSSQELKTCFIEAAERGQVILTTII